MNAASFCTFVNTDNWFNRIHPAAASPLGQHVEKRLLVDLVMTFAQTFRAALVGGSEAIVCFVTQSEEPDATPLHLEQTGRSLVVRFATDAWIGGGPRVTGESTAHVVGLVFGATLQREPFGSVPEVILQMLRGHLRNRGSRRCTYCLCPPCSNGIVVIRGNCP